MKSFSRRNGPPPTHEERREFFMEGQQALTVLSVGADMERRMIFLVGEVNEEMMYRFITVFKIMDQTDGPIAIFMNSGGGSMWDGAAIYDTIRTAHNPVVIQGTGHIMSMASVILQAGTLRFLTPETRVMIHNASLGAEGHLQAISSYVRDVEKLDERYAQILADRTGHGIEVVKEWCRKETFLSAQEAVERGLADAVTTNRFLPHSYEEGVAEINKFLPQGFELKTSDDNESKTPVLKGKKAAPKKKGKKGK